MASSDCGITQPAKETDQAWPVRCARPPPRLGAFKAHDIVDPAIEEGGGIGKAFRLVVQPDEQRGRIDGAGGRPFRIVARSEEHTSELQSLMRTAYAVFCL